MFTELPILSMIFGFGLCAGFVDAIAGGGGLIMLPGLLLSGLPVSIALGTNKLCGTAGSIASSVRFAQARQVDWRVVLLMGIPAFGGALIGARCIGLLPKEWAEPVVIVMMIAITGFVVFNPKLGTEPSQAKPLVTGRVAAAKLIAAGLVIGFHDGFFGPGTGTFLVFTIVAVRHLGFLRATGTTKWINLITNVAALGAFIIMGNINYTKGVAGAVGLAAGAWLGAGLAAHKGAALIRPLFVCVTTVLVIKLLLT